MFPKTLLRQASTEELELLIEDANLRINSNPFDNNYVAKQEDLITGCKEELNLRMAN